MLFKFTTKITCLLFLMSFSYSSQASHLIGGNISYKSTNNALTYDFTITIFTHIDNVKTLNGIIFFGDGQEAEVNQLEITPETVDNQWIKHTILVSHTYASPGTYVFSFEDNGLTNNLMNYPEHDNIFYIEASLIIDPVIGENNSTISTIDPSINAESGQRFDYDQGFFDPDGDSIAVQFISPYGKDQLPKENYALPNLPEFYAGLDYGAGNQNGDGPPQLFIDPDSHIMTWDAPGNAGTYLIALLVEEFRTIDDEKVKIGHRTINSLINVISNLEPVAITRRYDSNERFSFKVFPNPAKSRVHIETPDIADAPLFVQVYTINGQQQCSWTSHESEHHLIPLNNLSSGLYILKMKHGSNYGVRKVLIE